MGEPENIAEALRDYNRTDTDSLMDKAADEIDRLRAENQQLREFATEVIDECECCCDTAWTARDLHDPTCKGYLAREAAEILRQSEVNDE